jgi:HNH endonuclease
MPIWLMSSYISPALRRLVATRAEYLCENCLIHEDDTFFGCEVDHIISEKHGGQTAEINWPMPARSAIGRRAATSVR